MSGLLQLANRNRLTTAILALLVMLTLIITLNLRETRSDRFDAIRAQGFPVTLAELDAWYVTPPPNSNAALIFMKALAEPGFSNALNSLTATTKSWLPKRGEHLQAAVRDEITELLHTNATAVRLLHSLPPGGPSRYPMDLRMGAFTLLPHLAKVKQGVILLTSEALLEADRGRTHEAMEAFIAAARLSETLAEEPILISHLVRIACWDIIATRLELVLSLSHPCEADLRALETESGQAARHGSLARMFAAERAFGISIFCDPSQQIGIFTGFNSNATRVQRLTRDGYLALFKATGLFQKDLGFYLSAMATNIAAAQCPFPERFQRGMATGTNATPNRLCVVSRMMLPALGNLFTRDTDHMARMRVFHAVLAAERFRRAHAEDLPSNLEALAPDYLKALPTDPYDGKPLRFKKVDNDYVIYSVGSDLKDDGGIAPPSTNSLVTIKVPQDIGIMVSVQAPPPSSLKLPLSPH